jgi:hypothetical protein
MEETDPTLTALCEETRRCREAADHAGACDAAAAGIRETAGQPQPVEFPFLFLQGLAQRRAERLAPAAESFAAQLTQLKEIPEAQRNQAVWLPATLVQLSEMRDCLLDAGPELAPRAAEVRKQLVVAMGADTRQGGTAACALTRAACSFFRLRQEKPTGNGAVGCQARRFGSGRAPSGDHATQRWAVHAAGLESPRSC